MAITKKRRNWLIAAAVITVAVVWWLKSDDKDEVLPSQEELINAMEEDELDEQLLRYKQFIEGDYSRLNIEDKKEILKRLTIAYISNEKT